MNIRHLLLLPLLLCPLLTHAQADYTWFGVDGDGGDGFWEQGIDNNWTLGAGRVSWLDGNNAVFNHVPGMTTTVTIPFLPVTANQVRFLEDDFTINGFSPALDLLTEDFSLEGPAGSHATINAALQAPTLTVSANHPTNRLTLTNDNAIGPIQLNSGILEAENDSALGGPGTPVTLELGGTLSLVGNRIIDKDVRLNGGTLRTDANSTLHGTLESALGGDVVVAPGTTLRTTGEIGAAGDNQGFTVSGGGTLIVDAVLANQTWDWSGNALQILGATELVLGPETPSTNPTIPFRSFEGNIVNNSAALNGLTFTNRSVYSDVISGTGNVHLRMGHTFHDFTVTAPQSHTGTTTITLGALVLDQNGNLVGDLINNGHVEFTGVVDRTYAGAISGTGSLSKTGTGAVILTGNQSYDGATAVQNGTLSFGNGGASTTLPTAGGVSISTGATLQVDSDLDLTYAGPFNSMADNAIFEKSGAGTLTLTGDLGTKDDRFSIFQITEGTLQIGDGVNGTATSEFNRSRFQIDAGATLAYFVETGLATTHLSTQGAGNFLKLDSNEIRNAGGLMQHTGNTTIGNGIFTIDSLIATSALANATTVQDGAQLRFGGAATNAIVGPTGGADHALLTQLTLNGHGIAGGSNGAVRLRGTKIHSDVTLATDSTIQNAGGPEAEIFGTLSGAGGLTKIGNGGLWLHGDNTYAGATIVNGGTLRITHANGFGNSPSLHVAAGRTVEIDATAMTEVPNGGVTDLHFANLPSTLSGTGSLQLVNTPATDGGGAPIGGAFFDLQPGGTVAPGNSPGTMTFMNNVNWAGNYDWELEDAASVAGTGWDLVNVLGADLDLAAGGTLSIIDFNNSLPTLNLTAGAVTDFDIFTASNILNFNGATFTINPGHFLEPHGSTQLVLNGTADALFLRFTAGAAAIPEPGTFALLAIILAGAYYARRKRAHTPE